MSAIYAGINIHFRPSARVFPIAAEKYVVNRIKGTLRQAQVAAAIEADAFNRLPNSTIESSLTSEELHSRSRVHPSLMGGEYLPDFEDGEIEVARIELKSVTGDVFSIRLRKDVDRYHYRVVDEYGGECLHPNPKMTSKIPLTLFYFGTFVSRMIRLSEIIELNDFSNIDQACNFIIGKSSFYPDFGRFISMTIQSLLPEDDDME